MGPHTMRLAMIAAMIGGASVPIHGARREPRPLTDKDREAMAAAEAKRARKRAKRLAASESNGP